MKQTITIKKEVYVKTVKIIAGVRYFEDAKVNGIKDINGDLIPCREGDLWTPEIDIESGKILNWTIGTYASVHYKVCDCCGYELKDESGVVVLSAEDGYVPESFCPEKEGYGDYIIMNIDADGFISRWNFDANDFENIED